MRNSNSLLKVTCGAAIASATLAISTPANGAVLSNSLSQTISVGGKNYSVSFLEDDDLATTYDDAFGSFVSGQPGPVLKTFADAKLAAQQIAIILDSLGNPGYEIAFPASSAGSGNVLIPFAASSNQYNGADISISAISSPLAVAGANELGLQFRNQPYQAVANVMPFPSSFASLQEVAPPATAVPTPALLPGLLGLSLGLLRKRNKAAG